MSSLLRLFLPAQWPTQDASCDWALVDSSGKPPQRGRSEPRHWPVADACELVLSAEQCLLLRATLPKGAKARQPEVIAFALEDHLIGDAEAEHFVAGENDSDGRAPVWVIARARLKSLLAALKSVDRAPIRACSEIQLLPLSSGRWSICLRESSGGTSDITAPALCGVVRTGDEDGFAFDIDAAGADAPPLELRLALDAARAQGRSPQGIAVHITSGTREETPRRLAVAWQAALGLPVAWAGEFAWQDHAAAAARNLLSKEFAPPRQAQDGWGSFRPAAYLGAAVCVLLALFIVGDWGWLKFKSNALRQQMADTFSSAFPQSQAAVDPPLQMQRLYDQLRRERGQLGGGDFLPLLAAASEAAVGQGKFTRLSYEDGRLEMALILPDLASAERLRDTMKGRGLAVTLRDTHANKPGAKSVEAIYALRSAP